VAMRWRKPNLSRNRPSDNANVAGSAPSGRSRHLPQRSAGVEDEHRNAGINSGRQVEAGTVLAVPPKCAVRDGVELLVLAVPEDGWLKPVLILVCLILVWFAAAGDPVANVASKGRAKDAKYRHEGNRNNGERKSGMGIVDHRDNENSCGNPNSCAENTESDNTSNHLNDLQYLCLGLHNPMRRHCQFTVKRPLVPPKRAVMSIATTTSKTHFP